MEKKVHFSPWLIILGCVGCSGLMITVLCNTAGLFLAPVMKQFGWSRTEVSLYMTIFAWVAAAIQPFVGKILDKYDPRPILAIVVVVFCGSYIWSGYFTQLWQWNLFGVIYGICAGFFMYLPQPLLINRWFSKKAAIAMSLGGIITGIIGFFLNTWIQSVITSQGWGPARVYIGVGSLIICTLMTILFVRKSPESMGMKPYGADDSKTTGKEDVQGATENEEKTGLTLKQAVRSPAFYLMLIFAFVMVIVPSFLQQIPSYAGSVAVGAAAGAFALSIFSIISLVNGPAIGWFIDKTNSMRGNILCSVLGALGMILILAGNGKSPVLLYIGVICFSFVFVTLTIGGPMLVKEAFGLKDYAQIYSWVTAAILISGGVAPLIYAQIYDRTQSYVGCIYLVLVLCIVEIAIIPTIIALGKRAQKEHINSAK